MKNLSITSIIEILTGLSQGLSYRKIQQQYGASKSSVARIATKLSSATISATQALKRSLLLSGIVKVFFDFTRKTKNNQKIG